VSSSTSCCLAARDCSFTGYPPLFALGCEDFAFDASAPSALALGGGHNDFADGFAGHREYLNAV
jgi:hypothetical protein